MEHDCIQEALANYNINASEIELLRHNENLTYRVGKDYLLQIHEPAEGFTAQFAEIYYSKMISLKGLGISLKSSEHNVKSLAITLKGTVNTGFAVIFITLMVPDISLNC